MHGIVGIVHVSGDGGHALGIKKPKLDTGRHLQFTFHTFASHGPVCQKHSCFSPYLQNHIRFGFQASQ